MTKAENPRAVIGDNQPPEPTPFEGVEKQISAYYDQIAMYLDGEPITSDGMAEDVAALKRLMGEQATIAEKMRVAEKEPYLVAGREIDARYKVLSDKAKLAIATCNKVETPWLDAKEAAIEKAARIAREEAAQALAAATAAIQSRDHTNLESVAQAEQLLKDAKQAEKAAMRLEKTTAKITNQAGRASRLRTYYVHELADPLAFGKYAWTNYRVEYTEFLDTLAKRLVGSGKRDLPGVTVTEERRAA